MDANIAYLRASLRISKTSSIRASRLSGGRSRGWMVCLADWRLRRLASSARYWSIRRTMASTFSRGSPSPPRVSLLHIWIFPSVRVGGVAADYTVGVGSSLPRGRAARESAVFRGYEARVLAPGVGRYMHLVVLYLHDVEARRPSLADAVGDGARGRDDQAARPPLDGVDGILVVVPAQDQLSTQVGEGVQGLLRVGEAVAARQLAPYGVVVDHDDAGGVGGGVRERLPHAHYVRVLDLTDNAEVSEAARDRTARDAVGGVHAGDDRARYFERRAQLVRDVPRVPGILEPVGLLPEEPGEAEVACYGPQPADVVVARDHHAGSRLFEGIQVGAGVRELPVRTALGKVAGDGYRVRPVLLDELQEGVEALGDSGPPEVQIRNVHERGHEKRFYPNTPVRQTRR